YFPGNWPSLCLPGRSVAGRGNRGRPAARLFHHLQGDVRDRALDVPVPRFRRIGVAPDAGVVGDHAVLRVAVVAGAERPEIALLLVVLFRAGVVAAHIEARRALEVVAVEA